MNDYPVRPQQLHSYQSTYLATRWR